MIDLERQTPTSYANYLASYIEDPSRVRAYVLAEFGRAPSLDQCRNLRAKHVQERSKRRERMPYYKNDATNFRCGHPNDESNIVLSVEGLERCATCNAMKIAEQDKKRAEKAELDRIQANAEARIRKLLNNAMAVADMVARKEAEFAEAMNTKRVRHVGETLELIAAMFRITVAELKGPSRARRYVNARAIAAAVFRPNNSLEQIAGYLNRKDHTTIRNLLQTFDDRCARDPSLMAIYDLVRGAA